jgi:hypothetical protein
MWPTLARARRLLARDGAVEAVFDGGPSVLAGAGTSEAEPEVVVSLTRRDVDRLADALRSLLGPGLARPDTPARLEAALAEAVTRLGGEGRPRVVRRPAGVTTPEAWQIRLPGNDPSITDQIRGATRGRPFTGTR